jgi:lysozyme
MMDAKLIADIEAAEGCKLTAYKDSLGFPTIGYGHLLDNSISWDGYTITQAQADAFLESDVQKWAIWAQSLPEWPDLDTACRKNAVIELAFNMGKKWLLFANCRAAIERQDWQAAHDQLLSSLWASQVHATRANRLAGYLLTGEYP